MRSIFYGWWIAAGVIGIQFLLAALMLQAFGTYAVACREEFGWSTTAIAFAVLHGGAWCVRAPQMAALRANWFGRASFATIMGFSTVIVTLGVVGGPMLAGLAGDADAFRLGFLGASGIASIAGLCFLVARRPETRT